MMITPVRASCSAASPVPTSKRVAASNAVSEPRTAAVRTEAVMSVVKSTSTPD